jgi:hypothetical protein
MVYGVGRGWSNMRSAELVRVAQPIACCGEIGGIDGRREIAERGMRTPLVVQQGLRTPRDRVPGSSLSASSVVWPCDWGSWRRGEVRRRVFPLRGGRVPCGPLARGSGLDVRAAIMSRRSSAYRGPIRQPGCAWGAVGAARSGAEDVHGIIECPAFGRIPILSRPDSGRGRCE